MLMLIPEMESLKHVNANPYIQKLACGREKYKMSKKSKEKIVSF